jgi:hypothetical protein
MADLGIQQAFARYGATLHNVQWSVCAWAPDGALVVSLWAHHYRKGAPGTVEYADRLDRWGGPGNSEFRSNLTRAVALGSDVRLVVASTREIEYVQAGKDASKVKKTFDPRMDLVGKLVELQDDRYVFRFQRVMAPT